MKDEMDRRAAELGDVEVIYTDGREDITIQLSQVENFIAQGMDSIVVCPSNGDAAAAISDAAIRANIPLVYLNRRPSELNDLRHSRRLIGLRPQRAFIAPKAHSPIEIILISMYIILFLVSDISPYNLFTDQLLIQSSLLPRSVLH